MNEEATLVFWRWFLHNESIIKECIENEHSEDRNYVVDQMNEYILAHGMLTWDIGLNDDGNWFLMLSPNGNSDMLAVSEKIMELAPDHTSWIFHASRPAKNWDRTFTIYDQEMDVVEIDASDWHYLIFDDEDEKFELLFEAKNISQLDPEAAQTAAEQFVIHEIGEASRIRYISKIEVVDTVDRDIESSKASVAELNAHLGEVI